AAVLVGDIDDLDAQGAAIGFAQGTDQSSQGAVAFAHEGTHIHRPVQIGLAQAEVGELEHRIAVPVITKRIELGNQVAELAIGEYETEYSPGRAAAIPGYRAFFGQVEAGKENRPVLGDRAR